MSTDNQATGQSTNEPSRATAASPAKEELIPTELNKALQDLGVDTKDPRLSKAIEISMLSYSGGLPAPPPFILAEYDQAIPGLGQKIVQWTEDQRKHRHSLEDQRTMRAEARMDRAQTGTLVVAVGGLCLAAVVGIAGNPWVAAVIAIVSVGGPTAAHILAGRTKPSWSR